MERPFILFLFGVMLFNWPIMSLFEQILPLYLFGAWLLMIVFLGLNRKGDHG